MTNGHGEETPQTRFATSQAVLSLAIRINSEAYAGRLRHTLFEREVTVVDGTKKSVGVVLPATLTFNTGAPEIMECVAGSCEYKLKGTDAWVKSSAGEKFSVPGNSSFEIRVTEPYHYVCHFG